MRSYYFLIALSLFLFSCQKEPGEGGKAEIRGRIMEQRYNAINQLPVGVPYPVPEQNVYIVYGEADSHAVPDDNVDTGPNGDFRFTWLRKGMYTVYVISECGSCPNRSFPVSVKVEIDDRKEVVDVGELTIENW